MTKATIVIPNYNHEGYLYKAVQSCLKQTYTELEVFVYDNQSDDKSIESISNLKDERLQVMVAKEHTITGATGVNKVLHEYATGELGMWLNSDDELHPKYLENLVHLFTNSDVILARTGIRSYEDQNPSITTYFPPSQWNNPIECLYHNKCYPESLFRRETFLQVGGLDEKARFWDWDLWIKFAFELLKGKICATVDAALVLRRIHGIEYTEVMDKISPFPGQPNYFDDKVSYREYMEKGAEYIQNKYIIKKGVTKKEVDDPSIQTIYMSGGKG